MLKVCGLINGDFQKNNRSLVCINYIVCINSK